MIFFFCPENLFDFIYTANTDFAPSIFALMITILLPIVQMAHSAFKLICRSLDENVNLVFEVPGTVCSFSLLLCGIDFVIVVEK
jgi:hypothetical protein